MITKNLSIGALMVGIPLVRALAGMTVTTNGTEVTVDASTRSTLTGVYGSEISKIVKTGAAILEYYPNGPTAYGGLEVQEGQFRFSSANALGAGDVCIGESANLMVNSADVTIGNKVVFGQGSSMVAAYPETADARVTLTSVGTPTDASSHWILLGRTDSIPSKVRLSLTNEASEAISRIRLQGVTDFEINGGTLKAREDAAANFVDENDASSGRAKSCWIGYDGFSFDIPEGVTTHLGLPFLYRRGVVTNVLESVAPENASFESLTGDKKYATSWTQDTTGNSQTWVGPKKSNDATWASGVTAPDGEYMMGLRWGHAITTKNPIAIASPGNDWYVTFKNACRPGYNGHTSPIQVTVDKGSSSEQTFVIPARTETYAEFRDMMAGPFELTAGDHTITIVGLKGTGTNQELFYDVIGLKRIQVVTPPTGLTSKLGKGTYAPKSLDDDARFDVQNGVLKLGYGLFEKAADITVGAQAGLSLGSMGEEIVGNGNFEADGAKPFNKMNPQGWVLSAVETKYGNEGGSGLQTYGGAVSGDGPSSPAEFGATTLYLRNYFKAVQEITVPSQGRYRLSFVLACRKEPTSGTPYGSRLIRTIVKIGDVSAVSVDPMTVSESDGFVSFLADVELTAGTQNLTFETSSDAETQKGAMIFVDGVSLRRLYGTETELSTVIRMSSGSRLELDNHSRLSIPEFYVDGVKIHGGRSAIVRAGVTVSGKGSIQVGGGSGLCIIFR